MLLVEQMTLAGKTGKKGVRFYAHRIAYILFKSPKKG
jgi:hypothetical protein